MSLRSRIYQDVTEEVERARATTEIHWAWKVFLTAAIVYIALVAMGVM